MGSPNLQDRWWSSETVAVVTGANKGLGFEIVRRLAVEGLTVILTARDERRGLESTRELHGQGFRNVVFRTLDTSSRESVEDFADWLRYAYGGLDILVNNAAIFHNDNKYESAVETVRINYQGTINVIEKLLPMFRVSSAGARIVTLTSWAGRLFSINDESLRQQLVDENEFDQDFLDSVVQRYVQACRTGDGGPNGYANNAYRFSKVMINSYLRLLAERLANRPDGHKIYVHNAHPGFVHTDMHKKLKQCMDNETYIREVARGRFGSEELIDVEEGADTPIWLCLVPDIPSGLLWSKRQVMSYL
ncbi:hypothetical protein M758_4G072200 [Ceratodon purpureus]|nr:hypothetical protein M758_4G072200 [Ceratodon purpureus]